MSYASRDIPTTKVLIDMLEQTSLTLNLAPILNEAVDWRFKGFPPSEGVTIGTVGEQGWHALDGDLIFPLLLLKESAMRHNIDLMARYCREHDVSLAPHGKTPIAPQIAQLQLEAGAWGITVANLHQARVFRASGVQHLLMANQLLDPPAIEWVARELAADPEFEFLCLVDSLSGVKMLEEALAQSQLQRPLRVLVEIGVQGGRSGCREENAATSVAKAILEAPHLQLAGIEGYEGAIPAQTLEERIAAVDTYLNAVRALASSWYRSGFFGSVDEVVITAGGSLFFDRVAEIFSHPREFPMRVMLRSGSYFAHDLDSQEQLSPLAERGKPPVRLRPALEFWGRVLSTPEPGLAIGGFGKRDAAYDLALPTPFALRRDGISRDIRGQVHVTALNDQHAFLRVAPDCDLRVGDVIGCHISHPCTSFDKWHLVPLVDDDYGVVGAIRCYF